MWRRRSPKRSRRSRATPCRRPATCTYARASTASPTTRGSRSRRSAALRASARRAYATDGHDFAANNRLLLRNLEGREDRRARFRTVIALIRDGEEHLFEGIVEGRIVDRETGCEGFGYDPLFVPDGYDRTFAEMTPDQKNAVSHRGRAVRRLVDFLRTNER